MRTCAVQRAILILVAAGSLSAEDALPGGYERGDLTHRVMRMHAHDLPQQRLLSWYIIGTYQGHPHQAELEQWALMSKRMEITRGVPPPDVNQRTIALLSVVWLPLYRVVVDVDPSIPESQQLLAAPAIADGTARLTTLFTGYPSPRFWSDPASKRLIFRSAFAPPDGFGVFAAGLRTDERELYPEPLVEVDQVIRTWQGAHGAPYREPTNAVLRLWCFHDYLDAATAPTTLATFRTQFDHDNRVPGGPHYELVNLSGLAPAP